MKYTYKCQKCNHTSENIQIKDRNEPVNCSKCGSQDILVYGQEIPKTPLTRPFKRETI